MTDRSDAAALFFGQQLRQWRVAAENYDRLSEVERKEIPLGRYRFGACFNPARVVSTGAKMDASTLKKRPCFLCDANRPPEQSALPEGNGYRLLVNPFPIFSPHFTIVGPGHEPQRIAGRLRDMLDIAASHEGYAVFYNGPRCGASAPDHFHFQMARLENFPLLTDVERDLEPLFSDGGAKIAVAYDAPMGVFVIEGTNSDAIVRLFERLQLALPWLPGDAEPMMNVLCHRRSDGSLAVTVIPRKAHRPDCYGWEEGQMLISPASVDLTGWVVTPLKKDFDVLGPERLQEILDQTCLVRQETAEVVTRLLGEPTIDVGLISREEVRVAFGGEFLWSDRSVEGDQTFRAAANDMVEWNGEKYAQLDFIPSDGKCRFALEKVKIGINFHWEREETQTFEGAIRLICRDGKIVVINHIGIEAYLRSVVSSEMSATASEEFLKAHAVISRSWVMAQILRKLRPQSSRLGWETDEEIVRWYDRSDHSCFDVCADDHCQRYQGVGRQTTSVAAKAVDETCGEMLFEPDGSLCDARFSKCCGGVTEEFENCWEPSAHPSLVALADTPSEKMPCDLTDEQQARRWIETRPEAFCNTADELILRQVLNNYDQETKDFYRWTVCYTADELSELVARKSGKDFGRILRLEPLERGKSGRIVRLRIVGEKLTMVVGKELEIRRWLSPTHLYSSAFVVDHLADGFRLRGAGWGHGVGLCQIGAAVMGSKNYTYRQILSHYFPAAVLRTYPGFASAGKKE